MGFEKLKASLGKSNVILPPEVMYYKALSGLKLVQPQLGQLMSILEAKDIGWSITELKRIPIKVLEATFLNAQDDILTTTSAQDRKEDEISEEEVYESEIIDAFIGTDGDILFELGKLKKTTGRNRPGLRENAIRNERTSYDLRNKGSSGGKGGTTLQVAGSTGNSTSKLRCFRCGSYEHTWRQCHLPFQQVLAFGNRASLDTKSEKKVFTNDEIVGAQEEGILTTQRVTGKIEATDNPGGEERLTKHEWLTRYQSMLPGNAFMVTDADMQVLSMDRILWATSDSGEISKPIIDCGATGSVVGEYWVQVIDTLGEVNLRERENHLVAGFVLEIQRYTQAWGKWKSGW